MTAPQAPDDPARQLVYYAAERTLGSWVRTALSLMALGFVIDRFDLVLRQVVKTPVRAVLHSHQLWSWSGSILIGMGIAMLTAAGVRYLLFALRYHRGQPARVGHGLLVASLFTFLIADAGVFLLVVLMTSMR